MRLVTVQKTDPLKGKWSQLILMAKGTIQQPRLRYQLMSMIKTPVNDHGKGRNQSLTITKRPANDHGKETSQ